MYNIWIKLWNIVLIVYVIYKCIFVISYLLIAAFMYQIDNLQSIVIDHSI